MLVFDIIVILLGNCSHSVVSKKFKRNKIRINLIDAWFSSYIEIMIFSIMSIWYFKYDELQQLISLLMSIVMLVIFI